LIFSLRELTKMALLHFICRRRH